MKRAKYINQSNTQVQIFDAETGFNISGPVSRLQRELEGLTIEPYKTNDELRDDARRKADTLYKVIKDNLVVEVGTVYYDMGDRFDFDYQKRGGGGARVRRNGDRIDFITENQANVLAAATSNRLHDLADAFNADLVAINSGDYSLSNLKTEESRNEPTGPL